MNKLKYVLLFLFLSTLLYSQEKAGYSFKDVGTWFDVAGPKRWLFGTSTVLHDSTDFVTLNKSFKADSIFARKDVTIQGKLNLDTNKNGQLYYTGFDLYLENTKSGGFQDYYTTGLTSGFQWLYSSGGSAFFMSLDTSGLNLQRGGLTITNTASTKDDIEFSDAYSTQQVKINGGDSAFTDYDANDAITCNLQSGRLTTKSLTTAAGSLYALTLTNSLITANSKIFASLNDGTSTQGLTLLYQCRPGSGSGTIVIYNGHSADAFNGTLIIYFFIVNSP